MKNTFFLITFLVFTMSSCHQNKKSEAIADYEYSSKVELNDSLQNKIGAWAKEGLNCYGIIVMENETGIVFAQPVEAKIIYIGPNSIKMKATKRVTLAARQGCTKAGLEKGDTWWEKEGDIFQTKEEAIAHIKKLNIKGKSASTRYHVD